MNELDLESIICIFCGEQLKVFHNVNTNYFVAQCTHTTFWYDYLASDTFSWRFIDHDGDGRYIYSSVLTSHKTMFGVIDTNNSHEIVGYHQAPKSMEEFNALFLKLEKMSILS